MVSSSHLDEKIVRVARAEELEWVEKVNLFTAVPRRKATFKPAPRKWVHTNKGDDTKPNSSRSQLVLRDIKVRWRPKTESRAFASSASMSYRLLVNDVETVQQSRTSSKLCMVHMRLFFLS